MLTRNHKRAILAIFAIVALSVATITLNQDYNKCLDNGNSAAQCTGRG
ncbi:hypothetical protein pEaSNUABM29_00093 [Erwinia phage pEa_SNUABM_29]|nr:hypothetical protein pEaSNUABM29_00093 [Erwinia phage pEa_SNUABM_29]